jgi:hypothetical protein
MRRIRCTEYRKLIINQKSNADIINPKRPEKTATMNFAPFFFHTFLYFFPQIEEEMKEKKPKNCSVIIIRGMIFNLELQI